MQIIKSWTIKVANGIHKSINLVLHFSSAAGHGFLFKSVELTRETNIR